MQFFSATRALSAVVSFLPLSIIGGIAVGVIGKYFYDFAVMYFKASDRNTVKWDMKGFLITVVLSGFMGFLLYGIIFEKVSKLEDFWLVFSASSQAGFFSQSIIGELGKKYA
jgi:hypothetical protein